MGENMMYKKYILSLVLCNLIVLASFCCLKVAERSQYAATAAFRMRLEEGMQEEEAYSRIASLDRADSGQRIIDYQVLERQEKEVSESDFQILCKIVEAEAGGEDMNGRILVANVILNRVNSKAFPNSVEGVVFQKSNGIFQFSPIRDGRYHRVKVSEETMEAVERALLGEDYSQGALYFVSRKAAGPEKMQWFDRHLTPLFQYGGHEFFS